MSTPNVDQVHHYHHTTKTPGMTSPHLRATDLRHSRKQVYTPMTAVVARTTTLRRKPALQVYKNPSFPSSSHLNSNYLQKVINMSPRLLNKVSIITGSSSGLGRAISLLYAREGAKVVCADLRPSTRVPLADEGDINTHDLINKEGGQAIFVKTDVGVASEMEALVQAAAKEFGRVDMLVSNIYFSPDINHRSYTYVEIDSSIMLASG